METHYFGQREYSGSRQIVSHNSFWHDYAQHLLKKAEDGHHQFLSSNFTRNADNQTAAILTFALMDLPLGEAEPHAYKPVEGLGRGMEIKPSGNLILFKKEVKEAPLAITNDILVTHRYVSAQSGGSSDSQSSIPEEFLSNRAYSCEVIMTNVSPQPKNFSLLYQIPQGSLPLQLTKYMKSVQQSLQPYTTNKMVFYFYFPKEGEFAHFPSNITADQKVIAKAAIGS